MQQSLVITDHTAITATVWFSASVCKGCVKTVNIVFFFDQPPKVGKGCFNAIAERLSGTVVYAYLHGFNKNRRSTNWNDGDYGKAKTVELGEDENTQGK